MRVGIIGAGAAGLAAAYEFGRAGHRTVVYERAPFLGGQASTFDVGGAPLERGYHHLFTSDTAIIDLIGEIGLGDRMRWFESKVGILHSDGRDLQPGHSDGPAALYPSQPHRQDSSWHGDHAA